MTTPSFAQTQFKQNQLKFERVKAAYDTTWTALQTKLKKDNFSTNFEVFIAAYKAEGKLEVWLRSNGQNQFFLFESYKFCEHSGKLGPKIIEGDLQTPEGFYKINVFNPESTYHLSLGIDYPNKVDLERTGKDQKPGGDIYIHGNCTTVGCIPLTDEKIKEVYLLAVEAKNAGQEEIQVYIFPFKMTDRNLRKHGKEFPQQLSFWQNLQQGYAYFAKYRTLPSVSEVKGAYLVK